MVYIICTIIYVYTNHINMAYSEFPFPLFFFFLCGRKELSVHLQNAMVVETTVLT